MDPPKREAGGQSEKRKRMVPHAILFVIVAAATNVVYSNSLFGQLILDNARKIAKKEKIHHPTVARVASRNTGEVRANAGGERQTGNDPRTALPRENVGDYVSGEMIVALRSGGKTKTRAEVMAALDAAEQALPGQVLRRFSLRFGQRTVLVRLPDGVFVTEAVNDMLALKDPRVTYAEPNHVVWAAGVTPNDPSFNLLWGLHNTGQTGGTPDADIDAPEAWDMFIGSSDVIIAVIDSGVDYNHPDLAPNIWINPGESGTGKETNGIDDDGNGYVDDVHGFDFCRRYPLLADSDPMDAHGHGTHVAGTLGAVGNNGLGVVGINWLCKIMCLRFLDAEGVGNYYDAAEALNYAVTMGARVINSSWGGDSYNLTLLDALTVARDAGVLFVAAAGNNATNNDVLPNYPSSYDVDNVVAVAATDHNDELWWASSWGATSVDLAAPGSDIYSTHPPFTNLFLVDFQAVIPPSLGPQLTSEGTNNYWGTTDRGNGNITLRGDVQSYPYRSNSDGAVLTPAFDTIGLPGLALSFYSRREIGNDDAFVVDVWDGAAWQEIYRRCCSSGLPDFFRRTIIDLERYRNAAMQVRFRWLTDNDDNDYHGVEIDDIAIQYVGTDYAGNGYAYRSGTSMATPHVAGAAGLLLAQDPGLSLEALKLRLLLPVDHIPGLDGLVASGGRLNVAQSLLVDGEPTPVAKCRYISLVPANPGQETALRVTLTNLPAPFEGVNGTEMWSANREKSVRTPVRFRRYPTRAS